MDLLTDLVRKKTINISIFVHKYVCMGSQRVVAENSTKITNHNQQNWIR